MVYKVINLSGHILSGHSLRGHRNIELTDRQIIGRTPLKTWVSTLRL
jgi:hypothetical protein